jgi:hypothetical protein
MKSIFAAPLLQAFLLFLVAKINPAETIPRSKLKTEFTAQKLASLFPVKGNMSYRRRSKNP